MVQPLPKMQSNPLAAIQAFTQPRRNQLAGLASGLLSSPNFGQGLSAGFAQAAQGRQVDDLYATTQKEAAQRQEQLAKTISYLRTQPGGATWADALGAGMIDDPKDAFKGWYEQSQGGGAAKPIEVNGQLVDPNTYEVLGDYRTDPTAKGGPGEVALQPTWLQDETGNWVLGQLAKDGSVVQTKLPQGMTPANPGMIAGDRTSGTVDAKTAAAARAALPGAQQMKTITEKALAEVRNNMAGMKEWFSQTGVLPRGMLVMGGSEMGKFVAAASPTNAQAFMQAREMLKGGGQITDYEGRRAEDAISRMQAALDTGDQAQYLEAVADFEAAVIDGYNKLVETAKGGYSAGPVSGGAADYKSKYGLE